MSLPFYLSSSCLGSCQKEQDIQKLDQYSGQQLHAWNKKLTNVIVKDIFSPPIASRIYVYPNIAAYEVCIKMLTRINRLQDS